MNKRQKLILSLGSAGILALGLGACSSKTQLETYQEQGYKIFITYDANGGAFLGRDGVTLMDMFKPAQYDTDGDGKVTIKLLEPTDEGRKTGTTGAISLSRPSHFFAGWYESRELIKNADGKVVDEDGKPLTETEDGYVYEGTEKTATPAYTYSKQWDFTNDKVEYDSANGVVEMTLYAAWVPYYQFNYYYKNTQNEWELYGTTDFDYKTTNEVGSSTADADTIWMPDWKDGAMNYSHAYANEASFFHFPKMDGKTFFKAYKDAECTQEITGSLEHEGTLNYETGKAVNRVQNVYVVFEEGERYKIETAEQLANNGNAKGYYEILGDLDFTDKTWPAALSGKTFEGKFVSGTGAPVTVKNVKLSIAGSDVEMGGLFGKIGATAIIDNVNFENVRVDIAADTTTVEDATFGTFAGNINDGATVSNVKLSNVTLAIGNVYFGADNLINVITNGNKQGITADVSKAYLEICGQWLYEIDGVSQYYYVFNAQKENMVDTNGNVSLEQSTATDYDTKARYRYQGNVLINDENNQEDQI